MTEITVNIDNLPEIHVVERETLTSCLCYRKLQQYIGPILCITVVIAMASAILIIEIKKASLNTNPCLSYSDTTLASQVSIKCIQFIWSYHMCTNPSVFPPEGYKGWWNQSPNGQVLVNCNTVSDLTKCGVGTYGNIVIYMRNCNSEYKGQGL